MGPPGACSPPGSPHGGSRLPLHPAPTGPLGRSGMHARLQHAALGLDKGRTPRVLAPSARPRAITSLIPRGARRARSDRCSVPPKGRKQIGRAAGDGAAADRLSCLRATSDPGATCRQGAAGSGPRSPVGVPCPSTSLRSPCPCSLPARQRAQRSRCASAIRARPSAVRGPVERPPWKRQRRRPGSDSARHAVPRRVSAPHRTRARARIAASSASSRARHSACRRSSLASSHAIGCSWSASLASGGSSAPSPARLSDRTPSASSSSSASTPSIRFGVRRRRSTQGLHSQRLTAWRPIPTRAPIAVCDRPARRRAAFSSAPVTAHPPSARSPQGMACHRATRSGRRAPRHRRGDRRGLGRVGAASCGRLHEARGRKVTDKTDKTPHPPSGAGVARHPAAIPSAARPAPSAALTRACPMRGGTPPGRVRDAGPGTAGLPRTRQNPPFAARREGFVGCRDPGGGRAKPQRLMVPHPSRRPKGGVLSVLSGSSGMEALPVAQDVHAQGTPPFQCSLGWTA